MAISSSQDIPSVNDASAFMLQYGRFEAQHKAQLESIGLPKPLWKLLYKKIVNDTLDIGSFVVFGEPGNPNRTADPSLPRGIGPHSLHLKCDNLAANSDVFLIDHAWTTTIEQAASQLDGIDGLLDRMSALTGVTGNSEADSNAEKGNTGASDDFIEENIPVVVSSTGVSAEKARTLLKNSGGNLIDAIMEAENEANGKSKAESSIQEQIMTQLSGQGGSNDEKPLSWKTKHYSCTQYSLEGDNNNLDELDGVDISINAGAVTNKHDVKCTFSPNHLKVTISGDEVIDGDLYAQIDTDECTWTLESGTLVISLVKRKSEYWPEIVTGELHINPEERKKFIQRVLSELWRFFQGYEFLQQTSAHEFRRQTNWYIQDEVGLSIQHSCTPNTACSPFLYVSPQGQMTPFSILWPITTIKEGDTLTRDYCPKSINDKSQKEGYLHSIFQGPVQSYLDAFEAFEKTMTANKENSPKAIPAGPLNPLNKNSTIYIPSATDMVKESIKEAGFKVTEDENESDIIFDDNKANANRVSSWHPLNDDLASIENTVLVIQSSVGNLGWIPEAYRMKTQINEFTGSALMDVNSWWRLVKDPIPLDPNPPMLITNNTAAAVRHLDVGFNTAIKCIPSVISTGKFHIFEKLVLVASKNVVFEWHETKAFCFNINMDKEKPEPYQIVRGEAEINDLQEFIKEVDAKLGVNATDKLYKMMSENIVELLNALLANKHDNNYKNFGLFKFRFSVGKDGNIVRPYEYSITPARSSDYSDNKDLVTSTLSVLTGNNNGKLWIQIN